MSTTKTKVLICPYCGDTQAAGERCRVCGGLFEPLSRQASHNAMGPWFVRDDKRPFQPGASYETIVRLIERNIITRYTILRSPTTKQFWTVARRVPGIAHLLGYCHNCDAVVTKDDHGCPSCGVPFGAYLDRNYLGLPEVKPLPWEAPVVDDRRARPPAVAVVDFRRAAEPLGLSSFASDDELRGMASRAPQAYVPPTGGMPYDAAADSASDGLLGDSNYANGEAISGLPGSAPIVVGERFSAPASPAIEHRASTIDSANSVVGRSMQRRMQRQQATIRWLMAVVGLVTVVATIAIIAMLVRLGKLTSATGAGAGSQSQPAASGATGSTNAVPKSEGDDAGKDAIVDESTATQPLDADAPSASMPAEDLPTPPADIGAAFRAEHAQASSLLVEARKEDRPLKDRIKGAEQAVALLLNIQAKAPPADKPATLAQELAEAQRLVERLKLQEFFP